MWHSVQWFSLSLSASFAAISPVESPQLVVLVTVYGPEGANNDGSLVAGPIAAQILNEVLPYMQVPTDSTYSAVSYKNLTLPKSDLE